MFYIYTQTTHFQALHWIGTEQMFCFSFIHYVVACLPFVVAPNFDPSASALSSATPVIPNFARGK